MVVITGPRQVGKTTLARALGESFQQPLYLNYDTIADRARIEKHDWAPNIYFYDWSYVQNGLPADTDQGTQFENMVAVHLLKHVYFLQDSAGQNIDLNYVRTSDGKEIDFVLTNAEGSATHFIEVKLSDAKPSNALKKMALTHPESEKIQVVKNAKHAFDDNGVNLVPAWQWRSKLAA
jgi:uncharacterized protein